MRYLLLLVTFPLLLFGCAGHPVIQPDIYTHKSTEAMSEVMPAGKHYLVDTAQSDIRIISYPDGRFGHAHVVGGQVLSGTFVVPESHHQVWADLQIQVEALQVDEKNWRLDEELDPDMSQQAIAGTRHNMLSAKLLNVADYPIIRIRTNQSIGPFWQPDIKAQITLAGTTRELWVPVSVHEVDNVLEVVGRFQIRQSEFGIEPFSVLGGILKVADAVLIRFRIYARLDKTEKN